MNRDDREIIVLLTLCVGLLVAIVGGCVALAHYDTEEAAISGGIAALLGVALGVLLFRR